ncbi:hypothetical protein BDQ17DRAFT_307169 [Cyathus striatus]|nr:hypothetical protein BDQ17DRAFT_307169 [Cyathus striatus]
MSIPNDNPQPNSSSTREVTDPVTHLPLTVHDISSVELEQIPPNEPEELQAEQLHSPSQDQDRTTKPSPDDTWHLKALDTNARHQAVESALHDTTSRAWWRDPRGDVNRARVQTALISGGAAGLGALAAWAVRDVSVGVLGGSRRWGTWWDLIFVPVGCVVLALGVVGAGIGFGLVQHPTHEDTAMSKSMGMSEGTKTNAQGCKSSDDPGPEQALWLNSLLKSLWPIVNPALFISLADLLEDSLQSSVPSTIHGVRVSEIGQGKRPIRIVGIRWLDPGAASQDKEAKDTDGAEEEMKAEEGDFVNLELALAYRSDESASTDFKSRSTNLHLLTNFYLPSNLTLPIWISLTSLLMTVRVRITLTPNPPFLSLCTLTILGKPHVRLSCTPLAKHFMNVMDIPLLSGYVQSAVDDAVGMYVAPRSVCLDLGMLLGGVERKDVMTVGVVVVTIRRARGLKEGDGTEGDVYVTVCWGKWGKPMWSTRIIQHEDEPVWEETMQLLVGPEEMQSHEELRLQLWDSDRFTADDHLGTVSVPLSKLVSSQDTLNNISPRTDKLTTDKGDPMHGELAWEVGYFAKTTLEQHRPDAKEITEKIMHEAEEKLKEAKTPGEDSTGEIEQQKREDLKMKSDEIITSQPPSEEWPSGIMSIRIEQIRGLEVQHVRESGVREGEEQGGEGMEEGGGDLPSSYCTVLINDSRVYKTRTKMKSKDPYFNASTEKFIRSWPSTTIIISVHDQRVHEVNPLLGVVVLPLKDLFKHKSHFQGSLPLVGGVGYGRIQIDLLFRSVQMQIPKRLLGWDIGELRVHHVQRSEGLENASSWRVVLTTEHSKVRLVPSGSLIHRSDGEEEDDDEWKPKHRRITRLAVLKRYSTCVLIQLRKRVLGPDVTPAFGTLWLKDLPDDEDVEVEVPFEE